MGTGKQYDEEYKKQAIKLAKEIGNTKASKDLGIPEVHWERGYVKQGKKK